MWALVWFGFLVGMSVGGYQFGVGQRHGDRRQMLYAALIGVLSLIGVTIVKP